MASTWGGVGLPVTGFLTSSFLFCELKQTLLPQNAWLRGREAEVPSSTTLSLERTLFIPAHQAKSLILTEWSPRAERLCGKLWKEGTGRFRSIVSHPHSYYSELQPELLKTKHVHWQAPQLASFPRSSPVQHELPLHRLLLVCAVPFGGLCWERARM